MNLILENPLYFIQKCIQQRNIKWTYHVNLRLSERVIPRNLILDSFSKYEIIEEYPEDKYLPSYLVYSSYQEKIFHILFACDVGNDHVRIITAYYPSLGKWEEDFKTRRKP